MAQKKSAQNPVLSVSSDKVFWLNDGRTLSSLDDLAEVLSTISEDTFTYHVNNDKNDFASWIEDVLNDSELAKSLKKVKTTKATLKKVKDRIAELV